ncbi:platelet endothelial cell adhesion molecule isoform X3 [Silurus meridionalis]|uniref:platelet endothelial cell adhesion molecule isoform X3 n=1 Tax=Silurus meridionalis TaxID=175797 RepID=UPI001EEAE655|nr:platelet endothelial cell adhesion molecule isoform X3 [Silurus meridionalis]
MWTKRYSEILLMTFMSITCTRAESDHLSSEFELRDVTLHIIPANTVERNSELNLTCEVNVVSRGGNTPDLKISIFKNYNNHNPVYINNTRSNKVTYTIAKAQASHSGIYQCDVSAGNQHLYSSEENINVTGLQTPELRVDKLKVTEGEKVRVTCSAREESGVLEYTFKNGLKVIYKESSSSGVVQRFHSLTSTETAKFSCSYSIHVGNGVLHSSVSNEVHVVVEELKFTAKITILPSTEVIEGDSVYITCDVEGINKNSSVLSLSKGSRLLPRNYSTVVLANDSGVYECRAKVNSAERNAYKNLTVKELFSTPVLTITPAEVFEKESFNVTCRSSKIASERIGHDDVKYFIYRSNKMISSDNGIYKTMAKNETNGNYTCTAQVNNTIKWSQWITFTAKVLVSKPTITVLNEVILNKPFRIECRSDRGSLPISYTLKQNHTTLSHVQVSNPSQKAVFTTSIQSIQQISEFKCEAQNNGVNSAQTSDTLRAQVTVPVGKPNLITVPVEQDITENQQLQFLCGIPEGASSPITFKWYKEKNLSPVYVTTVNFTNAEYTILSVEGSHSGSFYCAALNKAGKEEVSNHVNVSVRMARWKKGLITGVCLMLVTGIVFAFVIRYRAMRVKVASSNGAGIWSVRPPVLDSSEVVDVDEPEEPNVEYTEVLHPQNSDPAREFHDEF